ncbi:MULTISPECIES: AAA family ATPase [unclassified Actinopolyspora]|uniref:AAA family ATPase n=1 Tax=unclassified Actinopolyspora TaxID=2639451 RepID=UPI0013F5E8E8|nr:AAA family ATPase [Actinopolyspora sp. BKK2]NHE76996.1 AAA family ATPase [Actinopolyspora sp. BKK1]
MTVEFCQPEPRGADRVHHHRAAAGNTAVAEEAAGVLRSALSGTASLDRILLKAAAGAGKSHVLKKLVAEAVGHPECSRVAVIAFTNKQVHPLAAALGRSLGPERVCLSVSKARYEEVPEEARANSTVVTTASEVPAECAVVVSTSHKLGAIGELDRLTEHLGVGRNGESAFDALFVDEAWQLPHHLFDRVAKAAPITVGVGDVGQLPPLEVGANPWRGDPGFNPYRAWPTDFEDDERTWSVELPAVWRPAAGHLDLWRAFYPQWRELHCVAAPGDRALAAEGLSGDNAAIWSQVGTGVPTLLEVEGLPEPESPDVDLPLTRTVESLLDGLLAAGFVLQHADYDGEGAPTGETSTARPGDDSGDPLIAILATRNQAVDDAADAAERLRAKYALGETEIVASTVDSWQGQTNRVTVAIHPLSGATQLDEFNSAFGRLAVTCTRATHGLLMVTRPGIDQLLGEAPARPGTPIGEPGDRQLPRQTHQRILDTFARGRIAVGEEH